MEQFAPFRITLPLALPAADRQALLAALESQAEVQVVEQKDGLVEAVIAIIKEAGEVAGALVDIGTLATMLYGSAKELRRRGLVPDITLFRPGQPELNLSRVQSAEEIDAWIRRVSR